ncbi:MAG TPA: choice-of-anchor R domain-containing protein [Candidatus Limnocylindria bacterium]|jgi:hypothetical protein|nr:choice-of-anchor R domain-containing protein [Candidatus Limnocylindria bacterium]
MRTRSIAGIPLLLLSLASVQAQINTLDRPVNSLFQFGAGAFLGLPFETGSLSYRLETISAEVVDFGGPTPAFTVHLYLGDADFRPTGASLATFSLAGPALPSLSGPGLPDAAVFTPTLPIILAAKTAYVFTIEPTAGNLGWLETSAANGFTTSLADPWQAPAGLINSGDSGASWMSLAEGSYPFREMSKIDATAVTVPEPATMTVITGSLLAGLAAWRRRSVSV